MNSNHLKILGAAVLLLALFLFFRRMHHAPKNLAATPRTVITTEAAPSKKQASAKPVSDVGAVKAANAPLAAGFVSVPLNITKGQARLDVHVRRKPSCRWGDLDLISKELELKPGAHLYLTIEAQDKTSVDFAPVVHEVSLEDLQAGFDQSFVFAPVKTPKTLAIFLCTDGDNRPHCGDKSAGNINKAYAAVANAAPRPVGKGAPPAYHPPDRIYFFQSMLLAPNDARVQMATKMDDAAYKRAEAYLAKETGSEGDAKEAIAHTRELNTQITSIPVAVTHNDLTLVMSGQEKSLDCNGIAQASRPQPPRPPAGVTPQKIGKHSYLSMPQTP